LAREFPGLKRGLAGKKKPGSPLARVGGIFQGAHGFWMWPSGGSFSPVFLIDLLGRWPLGGKNAMAGKSFPWNLALAQAP